MFYSYYSFFFKYIFFCAPNQFMAVQFIILCTFVLFLPCNKFKIAAFNEYQTATDLILCTFVCCFKADFILNFCSSIHFYLDLIFPINFCFLLPFSLVFSSIQIKVKGMVFVCFCTKFLNFFLV